MQQYSRATEIKLYRNNEPTLGCGGILSAESEIPTLSSRQRWLREAKALGQVRKDRKEVHGWMAK